MSGVEKKNEIPDCFYQPGRKGRLNLVVQAPAYRLLQQVRDEAHRFAINYHRLLRQRVRDTILLEIDGIGKKRARHLLKIFGSVETIMLLTPEMLAEKAGIPLAAARNIVEFFR